MDAPGDMRPALAEKAADIMGRLSAAEREALLIKCWMSHDARWFMAVASEFGMEVTNRLNKVAAYEVGKAETARMMRALDLSPATTVDDYLLVQEALISLLGPNLIDYTVSKVSDGAFRVDVQRCFANENAVRAGIAGQYECGIFARIAGWLEAMGLPCEMDPGLGPCLKVKGEDCAYTFSVSGGDGGSGVSGLSRESTAQVSPK